MILISIPRPLARPDAVSAGSRRAAGISIPRPLARPDPGFWHFASPSLISIPRPLARPDPPAWCNPQSLRHFNSQASCEARRFQYFAACLAVFISIPRPLARPDRYFCQISQHSGISIPRPLARPDTKGRAVRNHNTISIPRPLARPDSVICARMHSASYFNSQASCEARLCPRRRSVERGHFNSQASCEARLLAVIHGMNGLVISIPRPLARPDCSIRCYARAEKDFNSQASCEARQPGFHYPGPAIQYFNSQASCEARR